MLISQYVYFGLVSPTVSAAEMTAVLGIEPDEILVRGSRWAGPEPVPGLHRWNIVCREPGLGVWELVGRVVARLEPHAEAIGALVRRIEAESGKTAGAVLEVVRKFHHPEGQDRLASAPPELVDGPDLLGWYLDRHVLDFLHTTRATLGVDEYDYTPGPEDD